MTAANTNNVALETLYISVAGAEDLLGRCDAREQWMLLLATCISPSRRADLDRFINRAAIGAEASWPQTQMDFRSAVETLGDAITVYEASETNPQSGSFGSAEEQSPQAPKVRVLSEAARLALSD